MFRTTNQKIVDELKSHIVHFQDKLDHWEEIRGTTAQYKENVDLQRFLAGIIAGATGKNVENVLAQITRKKKVE